MKKSFFFIFICIIILIAFIAILARYEVLKKQVISHFSQVQHSYFVTQYEKDLLMYPQDLINMVLSVEDQLFLQHNGVDIGEIFIVLKDYLFKNAKLRGASTISQQLIKNTLLSPERTLKRKFIELWMTLILEQNFSKEFILANYLNIVYLGQDGKQSIYGFTQAAQFYFNKPPETLHHKEMAKLVALLKGASYYHPVRNKDRLEKRQSLVLRIFNKYQQYDGKYTRY